MRDFLTLVSPCGRTSRSHFAPIILAAALLLLVVVSVRDIGAAAAISVGVIAELIILIATIRRLHDAGRSRWWAILFFFPMDITLDLLTVHVSAGTWDVLKIFPIHLGEANWHLVDVRAVITLVPILIGLLAPSRAASEQAARNALAV